MKKPRTWKAWMIVAPNGEWLNFAGSREWATKEFAHLDLGDEVIKVVITEVVKKGAPK
jgi:hypothetical protein